MANQADATGPLWNLLGNQRRWASVWKAAGTMGRVSNRTNTQPRGQKRPGDPAAAYAAIPVMGARRLPFQGPRGEPCGGKEAGGGQAGSVKIEAEALVAADPGGRLQGPAAIPIPEATGARSVPQ